MALHPVLQEKLAAGLEPVSAEGWTRRDTRLPAIRNKVHTVLGMRRVGKTTFLRQMQQVLLRGSCRGRFTPRCAAGGSRRSCALSAFPSSSGTGKRSPENRSPV
jgi:hypothetical protein